MGQAQGQPARSARCIALVGPYLSGKTTLLEAILARTGAVSRQGSMAAQNTVGDASRRARHHGMSVELNVAKVDFLGDSFTFLDCPGSIEFQADALNALTACDAAVVVCEPDEKKVPALQLILKQLEDRGIPHFLFINKIDKAEARVRDIVPMLQPASTKPLVLRQMPIWENDIVTGFIDLALERAFVYREHAPSEVIAIPDPLADREKEARFSMLEKLADYDDELMEQLLEDVPPPRDKVFDDLSKELRDGLICPVLLGSAENGHGILRLLKALRHEAPFVEVTAKRLGVAAAPTCAYVLKTFHTAHGGKLSLARVLAGAFADGTTVYGGADDERISGVFTLLGQEPTKRGEAIAGDTVAFGRLDTTKTGDTLTAEKGKGRQSSRLRSRSPCSGSPSPPRRRRTRSSSPRRSPRSSRRTPRSRSPTARTWARWCCGGRARCICAWRSRSSCANTASRPPTRPRQIPYKETIRKSVEVRGRHKKQSGGHGQFGDVVVTIKPQPRGAGFEFSDEITGGVVPKNYIPSVEIGVRDYLHSGRSASSGRRRGLPDRRLLSLGRFLRHGVPPGRPHRHERGHAAMLARCCSSRSWRWRSRCRRRPRRGSTASCRRGAGRSWASTRAPAGPAGTWSRRICPSPRSRT